MSIINIGMGNRCDARQIQFDGIVMNENLILAQPSIGGEHWCLSEWHVLIGLSSVLKNHFNSSGSSTSTNNQTN